MFVPKLCSVFVWVVAISGCVIRPFRHQANIGIYLLNCCTYVRTILNIIGKLLINIISLYHILALSNILFKYVFSSGVICLVWIRLVGFAKRIFACTLISALIQRGQGCRESELEIAFSAWRQNAKWQTHLAVFCSNHVQCCWGTYRSTHQLDVRQGRLGTGSHGC